jgi:hypothetical protein
MMASSPVRRPSEGKSSEVAKVRFGVLRADSNREGAGSRAGKGGPNEHVRVSYRALYSQDPSGT